MPGVWLAVAINLGLDRAVKLECMPLRRHELQACDTAIKAWLGRDQRAASLFDPLRGLRDCSLGHRLEPKRAYRVPHLPHAGPIQPCAPLDDNHTEPASSRRHVQTQDVTRFAHKRIDINNVQLNVAH